MKRIILSLAVLILAAGAAFADNDTPITVEQLPDTARQFIARYFPEGIVSRAKMEKEFLDKSYEVVFTNGSKVEFNGRGEWKEVNCPFTQLPEGIVPPPVKTYVAANYPDAKMVAIDYDKRDYEVKLNNGFELKFNLQFELMEIDD
ncbi:MAG: PepSY-like domain-containing protein [Culturomica sp.]|jgi:hypothetical protein|nr:PepSY-like domain-containing protein [Culturomica sp.]